MPFLNYGGPVGSPAAQHRLSAWAVEEAKRTRADAVDLRNLAPAALAAGLSPLARKITVVLELPASADTLWNQGFDAKLRSQIKRAQRESMTVRFGADQVTPFYDVFARNMRDLGTPVLPRRLFEALAHAFPGQVVFGVIYHQHTPVAAGCGFLWRGEFEMTWASSLREFNARAPNMLLYWSFMEQMIGQGAHTFNFGRCTPDGGTHRFKLQWGGRDVALGWSQWRRRAVAEVPAKDRGTFRLAASLWQRLPLPVANRLGPVLSRRIPAF
jgi:FemAB-related protein (PEP-CTERM system-associated)